MTDEFVAPYTGAWIEIMVTAEYLKAHYVAPYTGAWIEIDNSGNSF